MSIGVRKIPPGMRPDRILASIGETLPLVVVMQAGFLLVVLARAPDIHRFGNFLSSGFLGRPRGADGVAGSW